MRKVITFSIAAYNVESYIQKCLDSFIVDSVLDKIEVIIVNDGSTDKTQVIAQTYCDKYPNSFFLINKENGGHGSTINKAIETSAGKYFKAVDGDDWVDSKQLSSVINTLETISEDIVVCNFRECYMQSEREHTVEFPFIPQKKKVLFSDIAWKETIPFHGIIYKTEILQKHRIRVTERIFFEDTELSLYPLPFVQTVFYIPTPLYCYRLEREGQSCSIQGIKKHIDDLQTVLIHSFEFYNKNYRDSGKREYYKKRIAAAFNFFYEATLNPAWYTDTVFVRKKQEIMQYLSKLNFGLYFSFIKKTKLSLLQHIFAYKHDRFLIGLQNTSKKNRLKYLLSQWENPRQREN
ncbi:glycosyltransferase family 2 protein [Treponema socranskii]|uniref:glycosyltransferase family 2 protein n=1 Tax=Treponema socranskii TaxID=53419 RepID=UPI003D6E4B6F